MNPIVPAFTVAEQEEMFALLRELVEIQSGSRNRRGVERTGRVICQVLAGLPFTLERVPGREYADQLVFRTPAAAAGQRAILITGHMDTVFPEDTDFTAYREDAAKVYGPGVIDMKGGLVVTIAAVRALARAGLLKRLPLVLLFNSDEEIGSPASVPLLRHLAADCCCGLVTECGGMQGQVVTGRRGKTGWQLDVYGRAGHAAFACRAKASAILELAKKIVLLEACNDQEQGVVVNVGRVEGGIGPNTVPEHATALIDSRYPDLQAARMLGQRISAICRSRENTAVRFALTKTNERPVMKRSAGNRELFRLLAAVAERLGIRVEEETRQGVSDANTLAGEGLPVLDGLGPIGEFDHSDREYMLKDSLPERALLLANFLPGLYDHFAAG